MSVSLLWNGMASPLIQIRPIQYVYAQVDCAIDKLFQNGGPWFSSHQSQVSSRGFRSSDVQCWKCPKKNNFLSGTTKQIKNHNGGSTNNYRTFTWSIYYIVAEWVEFLSFELIEPVRGAILRSVNGRRRLSSKYNKPSNLIGTKSPLFCLEKRPFRSFELESGNKFIIHSHGTKSSVADLGLGYFLGK